jgi:hypothetical protein
MTTEKRWTGDLPTECDIGKHVLGESHPLTDGFIDGATTFGQWANMCPSCHARYGVGLGTGRGQQYDAEGVKVAG